MFFFANLNCLQGGVTNLITYTNINCFDLPKNEKKKQPGKSWAKTPHIYTYLLICFSVFSCCWYFQLLNLRSSHPAAINHLQKLFF